MIRIEDLKRRRNEWVQDTDSIALLDADDFVHRIQRVFGPKQGKFWALSWVRLDSQYGPNIGITLYESEEAAKKWVDEFFCEHFAWFDAA